MGLVRGSFVFFLGFLLFFSFLIMNFCLTLVISLDQTQSQTWLNSLYVVLVFSLILVVLMFLFINKRENVFLYVGILIFIPALIVLWLGKAVVWLFTKIAFSSIVLPESFFSQSIKVFWTMFFIVFLLIGIWLALKAFKFGWFIERFASGGEDVKEKKVVKKK